MSVSSRASLSCIVAFVFAVVLPTAAEATTFVLDSGSISLTVDEYAPGTGFYRAADSMTVDIDSATFVVDSDTNEIISLDIVLSSRVDRDIRSGTPVYDE